jgi:hypothetical protein
MNQLITNLEVALEDVNNPLHYYWESCYSTNLEENFVIVLN